MLAPVHHVPPQPRYVEGYWYAFRHASQRLWERYNVALSYSDYVALCLHLSYTPPDHLPYASRHQEGQGRPILALRVQGIQTRAVYNHATGLVLTFLPYAGQGGSSVENGERAWAKRQSKRQSKRQKRYKRCKDRGKV